MFLTNDSPDLYASTLCMMLTQKYLVLAQFAGLSANSNKNYSHYKLQAFPNICRSFWKY